MTQIFKPSLGISPVQWSWVTLIGPDAQDFLHRLTTVHVKSLGLGQGSPGCFLTAQGKIRVYFNLWNYRPDEYAFELDAGSSGKWKNDLLAAVDQFTFGEKLVISDATPSLDVNWIFPSADTLAQMGASQLEPGQTLAIDEEIRLCHQGSQTFGRPWITAWGRPARLAQWKDRFLGNAQNIDFSQLESWRIDSLSPRVDTEITESALPLEVGLRNAIADNKGCYPGQEVIEKIISLGSPPKRLVRLEGTGEAPQTGDTILNLAEPPSEVGQVTSSYSRGEKFVALGSVRKIHAKEGLEIRFRSQSLSSGSITRVSSYDH